MNVNDSFPQISGTYFTSLTEPNVSFEKIKFSEVLKAYKKKKPKPQHRKTQEVIKEEDVDKEIFEEDKDQYIINQRHLVTLFQDNHSNDFEQMKKETILKNQKTEKKKEENPLTAEFGETIYSGKRSMNDYFKKYHQFKIVSRKQPIELYTPSFAFIKGAHDEKIVPNPLGLIKRRGEEYRLDVNNQKLGDNYLKVLSKSLEYSKNFNAIELKGNRMTCEGATFLFKSLNLNKNLIFRIRTLDLSKNKIGKKNIGEMLEYLQDPKCSLENLNIAENNLGNTNVTLICDILAKFGNERMVKLNLSKNQITDDAIPSICEMIKRCVLIKVFIINWNNICNPGATKLMKTLRTHSELRVFDIAWNNIGNNLLKKVVAAEIENNYLSCPQNYNPYNFDVNEIRDTMKYVFVPRTGEEEEPKAKGKNQPQKADNKKKGTEVPEKNKFEKKKPIPVLPPQVTPFANELGEYFKEQTNLIHLDISHNNLQNSDAKLLSKTVRENHTILGIHCDGNEMETDPLGFVNPLETNKKSSRYYAHSQIYYELGNDFILAKTKVDNVRKIRGKNNCWICEGWREVEFEFIPNVPIIDPNSHLLKIHLSFENYKPFDMVFDGKKCFITRMCPPGKIHYFFTIDTVPFFDEDSSVLPEVIMLPKDQVIEYEFDSEYMDELNNIREKLTYEREAREKKEKEKKEEEEKKEDEGKKEEDEGKKEEDEEKKEEDEELVKSEEEEEEEDEKEEKEEPVKKEEENEQQVKRPLKRRATFMKPDKNEKIIIKIIYVGEKIVDSNPRVINEDFVKTLRKDTEPRPLKIINRFVRPRTPWTFPVSIWAFYGYDYNGESIDFIRKCFEYDFERCQFEKEKDFRDKAKYQALKDFLWVRYRDIIDCYKYYASFSGFQLWQITQNSLVEFISKSKICDDRYEINDVLITQKAVCSSAIDIEERKVNRKTLSENNIVRHQFLNFLVKCAKDKYITKLREMTDCFEAAQKTFNEQWDKIIKGYEYHSWRKERYYNERVDNFLKAYLPVLDAVYRSYAAQKGPKKSDVWMTTEEYGRFVSDIVDQNEYPIVKNPLFFNYSIKLQENEITNGARHCIMMLYEFLEAMCRAIDIDSPRPPKTAEEEWPREKREKQLLIEKLENKIEFIIKLISHNDFKYLIDKFPRPQKNAETGLYIINSESPFYQGFIIPKPK